MASVPEGLNKFEEEWWGKNGREDNQLEKEIRRADDPRINPFDMYVSFGDPTSSHYTVQKIHDVYITGTAKEVSANGNPILESYQFLAKGII